jgi:hypothetical protein
MPKGEKALSPKQKDRTTILTKKLVYISNWYQKFSIKKVFISIGILFDFNEYDFFFNWPQNRFSIGISFGFKFSISVEISIGIISFLASISKMEKCFKKNLLKAKGRFSSGGAFI